MNINNEISKSNSALSCTPEISKSNFVLNCTREISNNGNFTALPTEIIMLIFSCLPNSEARKSFNLTNKCFYEIARERTLHLKASEKVKKEDLENFFARFRNLNSIGFHKYLSNKIVIKYPNLTSLNLQHTSLVTNEGINKLINLKYLSLYRNHSITNIGIKILTNLTHLDRVF